VFEVDERGWNGGVELGDGGRGELMWGVKRRKDIGGGMGGDIDGRYKGGEVWGEGSV
uniref:rhamnogalacturonan lyase family protein n=1 Tax=Paenibacillus xylanexedens TaxID=528191 RepID=UPI0034D9641F